MNVIVFCCHSLKVLSYFVPLWKSEIKLVVELSKLGVKTLTVFRSQGCLPSAELEIQVLRVSGRLQFYPKNKIIAKLPLFLQKHVCCHR